jgi:hypothetical protein
MSMLAPFSIRDQRGEAIQAAAFRSYTPESGARRRNGSKNIWRHVGGEPAASRG